MRKASLYEIVNSATGQKYIGVTIMTVKQRWAVHLYKMRRGLATEKMQAAFNEYGEDSFTVNKLSEGSLEDMLDIERELTKESSINGYNAVVGGGDTNERKAVYALIWKKIRSSQYREDEYKSKLREINTGKKMSEASKEKMSLAKKGKTWKDEHKKNRSILYSGTGNPNAGKFKTHYLNTLNGIFYTIPELCLLLGKNEDWVSNHNRKGKHISNFIKV